MKKDKLIAMLQAIEGNPDIYIWNGFCEDWVDIEPTLQKDIFVKYNKEHVINHIRMQYMNDVGRFELTAVEESRIQAQGESSYKSFYSNWDFPNRYVQEDEFKEWYSKQKPIYLINAKIKGAKMEDRLGSMSY